MYLPNVRAAENSHELHPRVDLGKGVFKSALPSGSARSRLDDYILNLVVTRPSPCCKCDRTVLELIPF